MADLQLTLQRTVRTPAGGWRFTDEVYNERWLARLKSKTIQNERGCWLYQGFCHQTWGYAQVAYRGHPVMIHRKVYELKHGVTLYRNQYVCHHCDTPNCCNPDHLWLGTNSQNQLDSSRKDRHYESRRTHCEHGHEFSGDNLIIRPQGRGYGLKRVCRECERERGRKYWREQPERMRARQNAWRKRRKEREQRVTD